MNAPGTTCEPMVALLPGRAEEMERVAWANTKRGTENAKANIRSAIIEEVFFISTYR